VGAVGVFTLEDGSEVRFDVSEDGARGEAVTRGLRPVDVAQKAVSTFDDVARSLAGPIRLVVASIRQAAQDVDEIEVAFGVRFTVTAGAVISQVGGDANLSVTMRWKNSAG
jgi:hypothetical protein